MLTIILGRVGSGKSLFAMRMLLDELRKTRRQVVTTLSVDISELNAYAQEMFPNEDLDVCGRVSRIDRDQLRVFWRHRGLIRPHLASIVRGSFGSADWAFPDNGVCYFLDEGQEGFGARQWSQTGAEFTSYATQHRKLGDDIVVCTPAAGLLDKQFRMLSGECVILDNWYTRQLGFFRAPRTILYRVYCNTPPAPGEGVTRWGRMQIEPKRLARCYRTEEGVGVVGRGADKGKRARGVPWWVIPILLFAAGAMVVLGGRYFRQHWTGRAMAFSHQAAVQVSLGVTNSVPVSSGAGSSAVSAPIEYSDKGSIRWTGSAWLPGRRRMFMFSDGSWVVWPSRRIASMGETWVEVDGERRFRDF